MENPSVSMGKTPSEKEVVKLTIYTQSLYTATISPDVKQVKSKTTGYYAIQHNLLTKLQLARLWLLGWVYAVKSKLGL